MGRLVELARVAQYRVGAFGKLLGMSEWQLRRRYRKVFECAPREWLARQQLKTVQASLRAEGFVKGAASDAGFKLVPGFCRWFKKRTGMTPSDYAAACWDLERRGRACKLPPRLLPAASARFN